jgi:chorismate synthase
MEKLRDFMQRRAPGRSNLSTKRKESDELEILSGLSNGRLCGAPFCAVIRNSDTHSSDYNQLRDIPRPGHADYTAGVKYRGYQDIAGGGHFSGRLTAPLCVAGGIVKQILAAERIYIGAHIEQIAGIHDVRFDPVNVNNDSFEQILLNSIPVIDQDAGAKMEASIHAASDSCDSVGGVIECAIIGAPVGLGDPMFEGMENRISSAIFAIPAIKGIEFGNGFECTKLYGSENNDSFHTDGNRIFTITNNHGGILGGITSGMPIIFRVAVKPTPSIYKKQQSVSLSKMENTELSIKGRHDPCIVPRAVPCVEAVAALAVYDALFDMKKYS